MELTLFCVFVAISALLIAIGFFKEEHTEFVLIGFFFLFLLSFTLIGSNLEYQTGEFITVEYKYLADNITLDFTETNMTYTYSTFTDDAELFNTTRAGYWLAVVSALGLALTLITLRRTRRFEQ